MVRGGLKPLTSEVLGDYGYWRVVAVDNDGHKMGYLIFGPVRAQGGMRSLVRRGSQHTWRLCAQDGIGARCNRGTGVPDRCNRGPRMRSRS